MGNLWQIINVDRRESSAHLWGHLGAWFFYPHEHLLNYISMPSLPPDVDQWLNAGSLASQRGPLAKLPIEILLLFFDELHGLHEAISFAITCKHLLVIGKGHVLRASRDYYAPWVGTRLISLDDSTPRIDDLPPNLLTEEEGKEIESTIFSDCEFEEVEQNLSNFSARFYTRVFHREWKQARINNAYLFAQRLSVLPTAVSSLTELEEQHRRVINHDVYMFRTLYGDGRHAFYTPGIRILCNLSKREYVRADGLIVPTYANLAHALLARVCWSSAQDVGMVCADSYKPQLTGGAWAGDRFCVTCLESLPEWESEWGGGAEWKNVTEEVSDLLTHIWTNNSSKWLIYRK